MLVDHINFISKAIRIGLPSHLTFWLPDFLTNNSREWVIRAPSLPSSPPPLGCPEERAWKLYFFLIVINDAVLDVPHHWKYMDDSTVGVVIDNTAPDNTQLQGILSRLQSWKQNYWVNININKTVMICLHTSNSAVSLPALMICSHSLQIVESTVINFRQHYRKNGFIQTWHAKMDEVLKNISEDVKGSLHHLQSPQISLLPSCLVLICQ